MDIHPLANMLEDLLRSPDNEDTEIQLAEALGSEIEDFLALRDEYEQRYARAVAGVCELRGAPTFAGRAVDAGFPREVQGQHVSCWSGPDGMIYLALITGPERCAVFGGAKRGPEAPRRETVTLQPPPS